MAKWKNLSSFNSGGSLNAVVDYDADESRWQIKQDETPFVDQAKRDREAGNKMTHNGHKKFATIPDIVAIEIAEKYGIDIHDQHIMHDRNKMQRFKQIIMTDYKYLVVNNA